MRLDKKVKASMVVVDCGRELYHLECARREFGDEKVLTSLRGFYSSVDGLSPADASIQAGQLLKTVDRLKTQGFGFDVMRRDLQQQNNRAGSLDSMLSPDLFPA